jgi:hypothetical protein
MKLLKAKKEDLFTIMQIIEQAQTYLATQDIEQWQNGYPNEKAILKDLKNNESYVVKSEDSTLISNCYVYHKK